MHVNLLPGSFRRQLIIRRCLSSWLLVWAACITLSLAVLAQRFGTLMSERNALAEMEASAEPIRQLMTDAVQLQNQLREQQQRVHRFQELAPQDKSLSLLAILSTRAQSIAGRVQVRRLALINSAARASSASSPPGVTAGGPQGATGQVIMEAVAEDDDAVASFLRSLRAANVFRHVELKSCSQWGKADDDQRKFDVMCTF
jgi:Tfp pilus assembly protein PilN